MPANKNAMIRYLRLDMLFRSGGYSIDELLDKVNDYLWRYNNTGVSKNTILADIEFMESTAGFSIELRRWMDGHKKLMCYKDRDFSIMNMPLTQAQAQQLSETIGMLSGIKGLPNFLWLEPMLATLKEKFGLERSPKGVVALAQNEYLKGLEWFGQLYDAIINERIVVVDYHPFGRKAKERRIEPYQLKQYNNRWYLLGFEEKEAPRLQYVAVPLDRIRAVSTSSKIKDKSGKLKPDFGKYFEHIVGVSLHPEGKVETVKAKIYKPDAWYVETKPLHHSQECVEEGENYMTFEWEVIVNEEFRQQLMVYAHQAEIMEPKSLRDEIKRRAEAILRHSNEEK